MSIAKPPVKTETMWSEKSERELILNKTLAKEGRDKDSGKIIWWMEQVSIRQHPQTDLIEHCGQSARGEYINTVSNTDIATGWWGGEGILGRSQIPTQEELESLLVI